FSGAGYHFYIRKNGDIKTLRPLERPGAHARGCNAHSVGICYEGGLNEWGRPADTRTDFQKHSLRALVLLLLKDYPGSRLCGHRDLSPDLNGNGEIEPEEWIKECPCFDAASLLDEPPVNPGYL
uniref:N-acetylmuramoyl-L-alanine amidase n=1 Tax=Bacteroides clarus TaxID=626929 RepID=UPI003A85C3F7